MHRQLWGRWIIRASWISLISLLLAATPVLGQSPALDSNLSALFPAAGSTGICPDTPLRITFSSPPAYGISGKIRVFDAATNQPVETIDISAKTSTQTIGGIEDFTYYPVIISGTNATIYPRNHSLAYGKSYYVTIDPGVFRVGSDWAGLAGANDWRFSTRLTGPSTRATNLTVAADGSADFTTVQGAIDFVPINNTAPVTILIKKGTYTEIVCIDAKHHLTIRGEDRKGTVITYANNNKLSQKPEMHIYHRGVFLAYRSDNLWVTNLTIRNTTPQGGSQAECIILDGNPKARALLSDLDLYSFKDTLQMTGEAYVADSYIQGDVDFIWGYGPCFLENCHLYEVRNKAYYTQVRNPAEHHGYVFHNCLLDGPPDVNQSYLTRVDPVSFPASEVVFLDCVMGKTVIPAGWMISQHKAATQPDAWATVPPDLSNIHFWEFASHDASGNPIDVNYRLPISRQLKQPQDAATIANYSKPGWVFDDDWDPTLQLASNSAPAAVNKQAAQPALPAGHTYN
jgi:pectin methylesterase-like acyl-CoA thioesterase